MADYILAGKIRPQGDGTWSVVVTSLTAADREQAMPIRRIAASRVEAETVRNELLMEICAAIEARGDRVIDVEAD